MAPQPSYAELFSRNIGVVTEAEQRKLQASRVAIAGCGGVGGTYALTLARMGIGRFHLADFDSFEAANFNRQAGAYLGNIGRAKTDVIREQILAINPEAEVRLFTDGVRPDTVAAFLQDANLVMDGLDFYALDARRLMIPEAEKRGIHVVSSGPIGLTTTLHVFGPGAIAFEDYFDFRSCRSEAERLVAFAVGVTPPMFHLGQIDFKRIDFAARRAPSFATAIQLCGGVACNEAMLILLGRRTPFLAPRYLQFDPVRLRFARGRLLFGNRGPLQRLKRRLALRMVNRAREA